MSVVQSENQCQPAAVRSYGKSYYFIKNSQGHYVDGESITRYGCGTVVYISFITFSPACRACTTKEVAEEVLNHLNHERDCFGIEDAFHIECLDDHIVSVEYLEFKKSGKKNMILVEYKKEAAAVC